MKKKIEKYGDGRTTNTKNKPKAAKKKITRCIILEPTGEDDLTQIANMLGTRAGTRSLRIRLALRIASGLTNRQIKEALEDYLADCGAKGID